MCLYSVKKDKKDKKKDKKGYLLLVPRRFQVCVCAPLFQMLYDTYVKVELITVCHVFNTICHRIFGNVLRIGLLKHFEH